MRSRLLLLAALLSLAAPASPQPAAMPPNYTITDLGTLGGIKCQPYGIGECGQVVGQAQTAAGDWHAFLWSDGRMQDLGTLGGRNSQAQAVEDNGIVSGGLETADGQTHLVRWQNGHLTDLGKPHVVGLSWQQRIVQKYHLVSSSRALHLVNINREGHATADDPTLEVNGTLYRQHGYLWIDKRLVDLGRLGLYGVFPHSINDDDQIVGSASILKHPLPPIAYVFDADAQRVLYNHAFLWQKGRIVDLNSVLPANCGWLLGDAFAINNRGQIAGDGLHDGVYHGFLMTPTQTSARE